MRYGYGVLIGATLSGIGFLGSTIIQLMALGLPDQTALQTAFVFWSVISFMIVIIPLFIVYFTYRDIFRRFFLLEIGSVFFFIPLWLVLSMEFSGIKSWVVLFTDGIVGIPFPGLESGSIQFMSISNALAIPILLGFLVVGAFLLRPSFIDKHEATTPRKPKTVKVTAEPGPEVPEEAIESEMPEISRPVPDETSVDELRRILTEIEVNGSIIERLITAGYATVTDLVAAKPEDIAQAANIDQRNAESLLLAIQKRVWFGDI